MREKNSATRRLHQSTGSMILKSFQCIFGVEKNRDLPKMKIKTEFYWQIENLNVFHLLTKKPKNHRQKCVITDLCS